VTLEAFLERPDRDKLRIALDPRASTDATSGLPAAAGAVEIIVGPEGGFGARDEALIDAHAVRRLRFGPRVLRADTAAIAICAFAQERWGDLASLS